MIREDHLSQDVIEFIPDIRQYEFANRRAGVAADFLLNTCDIRQNEFPNRRAGIATYFLLNTCRNEFFRKMNSFFLLIEIW
jgi:hypothetical protein